MSVPNPTMAISGKLKRSDLARLFPQVFGNEARPLKLGVTQDLLQLLGPKVTIRDLKRVLSIHTARKAYLRATAQGGPRYALDGTATGEISAKEQAWAEAELIRLKEQVEDVGHRAGLLKKIEASGLTAEKYAIQNGLDIGQTHSAYDKGLHERRQRRQERTALVEAFEASGLDQAAFLRKKRIDPAKFELLLKKVAGYRAGATSGTE